MNALMPWISDCPKAKVRRSLDHRRRRGSIARLSRPTVADSSTKLPTPAKDDAARRVYAGTFKAGVQ